MWQKIETYFIVTVLTALMWLYAEDANVREHTLSLDVRLTAPATRNLLIKPASAQPVKVIVRCPTGEFQNLRRLEDKPVELVVNDDPSQPSQRLTLLLTERIEALPAIADRGVIVSETEPQAIDVEIERLDTRTLPIRVNPGSLVLQGQATVQPAEVTLTAPATLMASLGDAAAEVQLDTPEVNALKKGQPQAIDLPVALPPALQQAGVSANPVRVRVTFTTQTSTFRVPLVPVRIIMSPLDTARYAVDLDEDLRVINDIEVSGPALVIEQLRKGELTIWAGLNLTTEDLEKGVTSKAVDIFVPPEVTVVTPPPKAQFGIRKLEPAATSP